MKFEIQNIMQNEDGTCNIEYDYDEEYAEFAKKQLTAENNGKEPTQEELEVFFAEALQRIVNQQQQVEEQQALQEDIKTIE